MGASFTNIQLRVSAGDAEADRASVIDAVRSFLSSQDFVETSEPSAERTLLVGPVGEGSWIAVYDEGLENRGAEAVEEAAAELSQSTVAAVGVLVHDSDLVELRLARDGRVVDRLTNWTGYFEGEPPSPGGELSEDWSGLLIGDATLADLASAWAAPARPGGAERLLESLAGPLGWRSELVTAGYGTIGPRARPDWLALSFRSAATPGRPTGPPRLGHVGGSEDEVRATVGEPVTVTIVAHNVGGPLRGLRVVAWGSAFDRGLVETRDVRVRAGPPQAPASTEPFTRRAGGAVVTEIVHLQLPAGWASPAAALDASPGSADRGMEAWLAARVEVIVRFTALATGAGEIHLGLVPIENAEDSEATWTTTLRVA